MLWKSYVTLLKTFFFYFGQPHYHDHRVNYDIIDTMTSRFFQAIVTL